MAVHEAAGYFGRPLEVGTVFAVDPELRVPEEKLYVRCEDTVAVTPGGCENLTAAAPLAMDEVEQLMAGQGLLQRHPVLLGLRRGHAPEYPAHDTGPAVRRDRIPEMRPAIVRQRFTGGVGLKRCYESIPDHHLRYRRGAGRCGARGGRGEPGP